MWPELFSRWRHLEWAMTSQAKPKSWYKYYDTMTYCISYAYQNDSNSLIKYFWWKHTTYAIKKLRGWAWNVLFWSLYYIWSLYNDILHIICILKWFKFLNKIFLIKTHNLRDKEIAWVGLKCVILVFILYLVFILIINTYQVK